MHCINKNYVLKPIYNNENECINNRLSVANGIMSKRSSGGSGEGDAGLEMTLEEGGGG